MNISTISFIRVLSTSIVSSKEILKCKSSSTSLGDTFFSVKPYNLTILLHINQHIFNVMVLPIRMRNITFPILHTYLLNMLALSPIYSIFTSPFIGLERFLYFKGKVSIKPFIFLSHSQSRSMRNKRNTFLIIIISFKTTTPRRLGAFNIFFFELLLFLIQKKALSKISSSE